MRNDKDAMPDAKKYLGEELTVKNRAVLMAVKHFMRSDAKRALKGGGKISGVAITARMGGLLHAIAAL